MATIKIKVELKNGQSVIVTADKNQQLAKNFKIYELANNLASEDVKLVLNERNMKFINMIQEMRNTYGKSMTVNSCYRTKSFNKSCGGNANSLHLRGLALDWGVKTSATLDDFVMKTWRKICESHNEIGAINLYTNGYHLEIASNEAYGNKSFQIRNYRKTKSDW